VADNALISVGLLARLEAKTGREEEGDSFLRDALRLVHDEPDTVVWFAFRIGPSTFGIFDAFPDESGREAHLKGAVATALMGRADELLTGPPTIEMIDLLAARLPALTAAQQD
jgi:hypothetical protein